jgi:hypothetical protein
VRVTLRFFVGRQHLEVTKNTKTTRWHIQWATRTPYGHRYDPPLRGRSYATRREAEEARWNELNRARGAKETK